jgi:hypothetical protein
MAVVKIGVGRFTAVGAVVPSFLLR